MANNQWNPNTFLKYLDTIEGSSTKPAVITTDAGRAYLKAINNPMGPHALVREWVGTKLANWFGLETFDIAIMNIDDVDEIPINGDEVAVPGPVLVMREVKNGINWSGDKKELKHLENPEAITRMVVFDTWTRNKDRFPPEDMAWSPNHDNVFFSPENATTGKLRLIAMDHSECFGKSLNSRIANIGRVKDARIYGLFDAFRPLMDKQVLFDSIDRLKQIENRDVSEIVGDIPRQWDMTGEAKQALIRLIIERAAYLADNIAKTLGAEVWPGEILFRGDNHETH